MCGTPASFSLKTSPGIDWLLAIAFGLRNAAKASPLRSLGISCRNSTQGVMPYMASDASANAATQALVQAAARHSRRSSR